MCNKLTILTPVVSALNDGLLLTLCLMATILWCVSKGE